jgi:pyruvate ferredoxin oxidoreductase gamma subunit/2-oxoisovalerate ferredoxin oxidoreductase gamma subunit
VDATDIAIQNELGTRTHPIINTAMIGAFARMLEMPPLEMISDAITEDIPIKPEQNIQASKEAYEKVQLIGMVD